MLIRLVSIFIFLFINSPAYSLELQHKKVCTWDPVGKNGPVIAFFSDVVPRALNWGLHLEFIPYLDENQVTVDLDKGICDVGIVTAILSRDYVPFAGTLDAIGGITSKDKLNKTMAAISSPKAVNLMSSGDYEVVATLPVGSMFAFVNDRKIKDFDHFRNKKIAVLNGDIQTKTFAELAGATPVDTTLANFSGKFNKGIVDIVIMPALAYNTFELYKGLGKNGGILDLRLFYGMIQAIARKSAFPDDFGFQMRKYMVNRISHINAMIDEAERTIPHKYWIKTDKQTKDDLDYFYKDIRLKLKIENRFHPKALSLLWKIRCLSSPNREECEKP